MAIPRDEEVSTQSPESQSLSVSPGGEGGVASFLVPVVLDEGREVDLVVPEVGNQAGEVILGKPLLGVGRQEEGLVSIVSAKVSLWGVLRVLRRAGLDSVLPVAGALENHRRWANRS